MFYWTVESNTFSTDGIDNSLSSEGKISPNEFKQYDRQDTIKFTIPQKIITNQNT